MRLKDYVRNRKKRKDYVQQPDLLMVGVDVSKVKHNAYLGTQAGVICRKLGFPIVIIRGETFEKLSYKSLRGAKPARHWLRLPRPDPEQGRAGEAGGRRGNLLYFQGVRDCFTFVRNDRAAIFQRSRGDSPPKFKSFKKQFTFNF